MPKGQIALIRGINVGGKRGVPMAELRGAMTDLGWSSIETYVQSGNVVAKDSKRGGRALKADLERVLADFVGEDVPVLVVSQQRWERIAYGNPFLNSDPQTPVTELHVTLADRSLPDSTPLEAPNRTNDEFQIAEGAIYIRCRNGYGRSKLSQSFFEKQLGTPCTTRNWKTVMRLLEMVEAPR